MSHFIKLSRRRALPSNTYFILQQNALHVECEAIVGANWVWLIYHIWKIYNIAYKNISGYFFSQKTQMKHTKIFHFALITYKIRISSQSNGELMSLAL